MYPIAARDGDLVDGKWIDDQAGVVALDAHRARHVVSGNEWRWIDDAAAR